MTRAIRKTSCRPSCRMARAALALLAATILAATAMPSARAQEAPLRDAPAPVVPPSAPTPSSAPALRTMPESLSDAIGTWDLSLDGGNRRCELSFSGDSGPNGRVLRFPAGCRRALPVLAKAAGWLFADKGVRIVDTNVRPLVEFVPRPDGHSMQGRSEHGERYSLVPLQTMAMLPAPDPGDLPPEPPTGPTSGVPGPAGAQAIPGSQPVLPADTLIRPEAARTGETADRRRPESRAAAAGETPGRPAPGVYALDRFSDKDVCRIALDPPPAARDASRGPGKEGVKEGVREGGRDAGKETAPAHLLPGCRDSGIGVFDPVSWRFAAGHLTLKAKRGHAVNLVATGDGSWRRDPDVGTTFVLRKVE